MSLDRAGTVQVAARAVVARYLIYALSLWTSVVVSRTLAADGRGVLAIVVAIAGTAMSFGHLSISTALAQRWADGDRARLTSAAMVAALAVGSAVAVVLAVLVAVGAISLPGAGRPWMLVVVVFLLPPWIASLHTTTVLTQQGRVDLVNITGLAVTGLHSAFVTALWALDRLDLGIVILAWAAASALPAVINAVVLRRRPGFVRPRVNEVIDLGRLGARYHLGSVSLALVLRVDVLLLGWLTDTTTVGIYALAVTIAETAKLAATSASQAVVHLQVSRPLGEVAGLTARVARTTALLGAGLLAAFLLAGDRLVVAVFGFSFDGTSIVVAALAPGIVALAMEGPLGVHVTRLGRPTRLSAMMAAILALNVVLNLLLIPRQGAVGAAIASSLSYLVLLGWIGRWFIRSSNIPASVLVPRTGDLVDVVRQLRGPRATTSRGGGG